MDPMPPNSSPYRHATRTLIALLLAGSAASGAAAPATRNDAGPPIALAPGVRARNAAEPFDYFTNSWALIGLKDYVAGTRITPAGELVLGDGLTCRPLIGKEMAPLNGRIRKVLRKGCLPIVCFDLIVNDQARYTIEALACPLDRQWEAGFDWPRADNFLNVVRVTVTNVGKGPVTAGFGLQWQRKGGKVACELREAGSKRRRAVLAGGAEICRLEPSPAVRLSANGPRIEAAASLAAGASASAVAYVPFRPVSGQGEQAGAFHALSEASFETWADRTEAYWRKLLDRGAGLSVPEAKPMDTYRASLVYQFIGRDTGDVHAGEGFYDNLYLRDGAYQAISLAHAGYLAEARQSLEHFLRFQRDDGFFCTQKGQLDGHGYAMWALVEYWRLSRDTEFLKRVYPQIAKAAAWTRQARRREKDAASPVYGVLPAAPADGENLWGGKNHIVGYDWWALRGIQAAAEAAQALGKDEEATAFAKEFQAYRECILRAIDRTGLAYIPPSYEKVGTHWGNLEAVFPTVLIDPNDRRLSATLAFVTDRFGAVDGVGGGFIEGVIQWSPPRRGAIHPYMSQFVTNSHIIRGEQERAVDGFYSFLLHTTSTHGFPEGVYYRRRQAWSNTVPHLWAAALYVTTLRNMIVREQGDVLHFLSAVPAHWLDAGKHVSVTRAPTHFGSVCFRAAAEKEAIDVRITPPDRTAPAAMTVHLPGGIEAVSAAADGHAARVADPHTIVLPGRRPGGPCTLTIRIRRTAKGKPVTFASKVAAYEADHAPMSGPIPHLAAPPDKVDEAKCVRLDLSRLANTDPLTAPFNVPNPGKYVFAGLPVGDERVRGVPFRILDPARNGGKGLVVLNGASACAGFPREAKLDVAAQGRLLCVLGNVTGWAPDDAGSGKWGAVGEYEVRYADGTAQRVPLISGRTVDDWAQPPAATDVTPALRKGIWHLNLLTIALKPKPVASVTFRDAGTLAAPVLAAMTLIK